jgi:hypothetical protein
LLNSGFGFGFAEPSDAISGFPLVTLFEQSDALESFQNVAFRARSAGGAQATVL